MQEASQLVVVAHNSAELSLEQTRSVEAPPPLVASNMEVWGAPEVSLALQLPLQLVEPLSEPTLELSVAPSLEECQAAWEVAPADSCSEVPLRSVELAEALEDFSLALHLQVLAVLHHQTIPTPTSPLISLRLRLLRLQASLSKRSQKRRSRKMLSREETSRVI